MNYSTWEAGQFMCRGLSLFKQAKHQVDYSHGNVLKTLYSMVAFVEGIHFFFIRTYYLQMVTMDTETMHIKPFSNCVMQNNKRQTRYCIFIWFLIGSKIQAEFTTVIVQPTQG